MIKERCVTEEGFPCNSQGDISTTPSFCVLLHPSLFNSTFAGDKAEMALNETPPFLSYW